MSCSKSNSITSIILIFLNLFSLKFLLVPNKFLKSLSKAFPGGSDGKESVSNADWRIKPRSIPKKSNAKECSNYCTTALISHASKLMLKFLQASMWIMNFQMFKLDLKKAEEQEIKLPTYVGSSKKQESSRKNIYFCFIDYAKAFDWVDRNKLWKILEEVGIPDHLTCLLRNLYAGQEATIRTGHGTTDWFQIRKEYVKAVYCHPASLIYMQSTS